jgi:hypothetical protein
MQSGRWVLLLLDLIGGGAVGFALIYVFALRRFLRKRLGERGAYIKRHPVSRHHQQSMVLGGGASIVMGQPLILHWTLGRRHRN